MWYKLHAWCTTFYAGLLDHVSCCSWTGNATHHTAPTWWLHAAAECGRTWEYLVEVGKLSESDRHAANPLALTNWYDYTQTSFCTTPFATSVFLVSFFFWTTCDVKIWRPRSTCKDDMFPPGAANTGGSQQVVLSPECVPSCLNVNLGAIRTPCIHVTLLRCGRMLKCVRGLM
jgi:hypothetical protein